MRLTYLEEGNVGHDASDDLDDLGIVVEQVSPVLLERHTDDTVYQL